MARQPFERKSLWHLSTPCYHIPISTGDNFETACTALRTNVLAEACKDENLSPCFQSLLLKFVFQRHLTACAKGCPPSRGHQRPSPQKRKQVGRKKRWAVSWQGREFGLWEWNWPLWTLSLSLVPSGSSFLVLKVGSPQVGRRSQGLYRTSTNWSQFQTYKNSAIPCSHFCFLIL